MSDQGAFDLLVIGGGINGVGVARDAAGRGVRTLLVEMDDLASKTSSASSKLIHGGLRYLEHYEFRLVREALAERERLLAIAPHIICPMTFVLPHEAALRPAWMIRAGLFLYDHLAARVSLPGSRQLDLREDPAGAALKPGFERGFSYSDCWVDDARLVVLNAMDARERGAQIRTQTRLLSLVREDGLWCATIRNEYGGVETMRARVVVNAAGPWAGDVLKNGVGQTSSPRIRLVKGSHIVVPAVHPCQHAYILQNPDRRIVFVLPYEGRFSLIGTTDVPYDGDAANAAISQDEQAYLCAAANRVLARPISVDDIVWSFSGVRPLQDNDASAEASRVTRDYTFDLDTFNGEAPVLSIFGGKITTYRRLAEHALGKLAPWLKGSPWTAQAPLPGGDIPGRDFQAFLGEMRRRYAFLPQTTVARMARAYGTRMGEVMGGARSLNDLGRDLGCGLSEHEVDYLCAREFARTEQDILWRRTKLGLHGGEPLEASVKHWLATSRRAAQPMET